MNDVYPKHGLGVPKINQVSYSKKQELIFFDDFGSRGTAIQIFFQTKIAAFIQARCVFAPKNRYVYRGTHSCRRIVAPERCARVVCSLTWSRRRRQGRWRLYRRSRRRSRRRWFGGLPPEAAQSAPAARRTYLCASGQRKNEETRATSVIGEIRNDQKRQRSVAKSHL